MKFRIETSKGSMVIDLFEDEAPETVKNFVGLATGEKESVDPNTGNKVKKPFYDGLLFHRYVSSFVIQTGDPLTAFDNFKAKWSGGGPGYMVPCETIGAKQQHLRGSLSMAHRGKNTGGSQFFICHIPLAHLNGKHTVFGKVTEGLNVLDLLREGDKIDRIVKVEELVVNTSAPTKMPSSVPAAVPSS